MEVIKGKKYLLKWQDNPYYWNLDFGDKEFKKALDSKEIIVVDGEFYTIVTAHFTGYFYGVDCTCNNITWDFYPISTKLLKIIEFGFSVIDFSVIDNIYSEHILPITRINSSDLWQRIGIYYALKNAGGKKTSEIIPVLEKGLIKIEEYWDELTERYPGLYYGAKTWLVRFTIEIKKHPDGIIQSIQRGGGNYDY